MKDRVWIEGPQTLDEAVALLRLFGYPVLDTRERDDAVECGLPDPTRRRLRDFRQSTTRKVARVFVLTPNMREIIWYIDADEPLPIEYHRTVDYINEYRERNVLLGLSFHPYEE